MTTLDDGKTEIQRLYDQWHESDPGLEAYEQARKDNPRYNDGDHHTDAACQDIQDAFAAWLKEETNMELDGFSADAEYVFEQAYASFT